MSRLRVVIADDQPMMRADFEAVLEATGDIDVVAEASTGEGAVEAATRHACDVVLMDIRTPDATTLQRVVPPSVENGQPAPGLRFGDPRVMAPLAALCAFSHLFNGVTNHGLRALTSDGCPTTPRAR